MGARYPTIDGPKFGAPAQPGEISLVCAKKYGHPVLVSTESEICTWAPAPLIFPCTRHPRSFTRIHLRVTLDPYPGSIPWILPWIHPLVTLDLYPGSVPWIHTLVKRNTALDPYPGSVPWILPWILPWIRCGPHGRTRRCLAHHRNIKHALNHRAFVPQHENKSSCLRVASKGKRRPPASR